ncbi:hypothetical protein HKCCE3408_08330 [Rhodobacterales bacterium HKCCE3408]|nr:hypothetical protein [Rhodobacterales bacterium HKCCE3408]
MDDKHLRIDRISTDALLSALRRAQERSEQAVGQDAQVSRSQQPSPIERLHRVGIDQRER